MLGRVHVALSFALLTFASTASARGQDDAALRTAAPRFELRPNDDGAAPALDALPLKATSTHIEVAGVIAHITVEQTWANEGEVPLEASYVFPAGARAAVGGMRMTIGERTIVASIAEREQARAKYEAAREEGRSASLLEQQRPNVLSIDVANILPGDVIEVTLEYTELLVPTAGIYELVFPQVVGPRYGGSDDDGVAAKNSASSTSKGSQRWLSAPFLDEESAFPWRWSLDVRLSGGVHVREVSSPSHGLAPRLTPQHDVGLAFEQGARDAGGDRDFVLRWKLADDDIQTGVLLYRDPSGEDFFTAIIEPPARVSDGERPPREIVFVVDVSGSMHGFPLESARKVARALLSGMRAKDSFNILFFAGGSYLLSETSLPATKANLARADQALKRASASGGTELDDALSRALHLPTDSSKISRSIVVITDGYVSFEKKIFRTIRASLGEANLFAFGVGSSVNRHLIDGMAKAGLGEPFVALDDDEARAQGQRLVNLLARPALTDVKVSFEGFDAYDVEPRAIPDLFEERPLVVFGKYRGGATGRVRVRGLTGAERFERVVEISDHLEKPEHRALRSLWARQRVSELMDFSDASADDVKEVTRLGLRYSLLTPYTSFVAVDDVVRSPSGEADVVEQPSPLPAGVSNRALGTARALGGKLGMIDFSDVNIEGELTRPEGSYIKNRKSVKNKSLIPVRESFSDRMKHDAADVYGYGGLGMTGTGGGGGGRTASGIGVGRGSTGRSSGVRGSIDLGGRGKGMTRIQPGKAVVLGSLSKDEVQRAVRRNLNQVRYCYEKELQKDPSLAGRVVVEFQIGSDGLVVSAKVKSTTLPSAVVGECIATVASKWRFPAVTGGGDVFVTYPFLFSSRKND